MKVFILYWIMGCLWIGPAISQRVSKFPHDRILVDLTAAIAIWPSLFVAALCLEKDVPAPRCERP